MHIYGFLITSGSQGLLSPSSFWNSCSQMCQLSPSNKYENIFEIQIISPFMYLSRLVCWNTHIYNINDFLLRMFEEFSHSIENPWIRSSSNSFKGEWKLLFFRFYPSFCKYFQLPSCFYLSKALSLENFRKIKLFLATSLINTFYSI